MRSKNILAVSLGLLSMVCVPAMAQQSPSQTTTSSGAGQQASTTSIRQHIMQDLEKSGFKNVKVAPAAFVAQATDAQGHPVMMLINPDSITTLTSVDAPLPPNSGTQASQDNKANK